MCLDYADHELEQSLLHGNGPDVENQNGGVVKPRLKLGLHPFVSEKMTFQGKSNKELITSQLVVRGLHPFVRVGKSHSKVNQTRNIWVHLGCT